jgi:uncharacterized repeat protein (TIGR03803 family)
MKVNQSVWVLLLVSVAAVRLPAQTLQSLFSFNGTNGAYPNALTLGSDGNFYGTANGGGFTNSTYAGGMGTVFKVTINGTLTTLVSFNGTNGAEPNVLTLGSDGNFYGTTYEGGTNGGYGTVFMVTTNGTLTTLVSFSYYNTNGAYPETALTLGNDGNFYGTTAGGNSSVYGTVFQVTTNGTLTTLVYFNNTNGAYPYALTLGNDGNFYGTTEEGGSSNYGTVFMVTTNGVLTTLVSFDYYTNGALPDAALTLGPDGNFYGTTEIGGSSSFGTVFMVTTNGTLTTLVYFNNTNGAYPYALTLGSDGNFYGTTVGGGNISRNNGYGCGTVFRLLLLLPVIIVQPQSQTNNAGATVTFLVSATNWSLIPMGYQWQKNGTNLVDGCNLSGATTNTLTITGVSDSDAAVYSVIVSNANGCVTSSNATLTVNDLPFIATQPLSQTVGVGSNVTFTAIAYGAPPFVFQWYHGNSPIGSPTSGTNVSSYTLTNVHTNQSGNYSVLVINSYDSVMSSNAVLTVTMFPPCIGIQPSSHRVMIGSNVSFNVSVSGTAPFNYQWRFNSGNILNATNPVYAIQTVVATNTGNYSVVVTNLAGSVTSSNALLTVIVPPTLALQFLAGYPVLNLNGMLSNNFVVQYSTNLADTNWINLLSLSNLSSSPYLFLDPAGSAQPARFYRAFMQ